MIARTKQADQGQDTEPATTNGVIALANLQAQVGSLETRLAGGRLDIAGRTGLIDLLIMRGHVLGRIADYERADALAEQLVCDAPAETAAVLARAKARATLHRFAEALADLESAEQRGADQNTLDDERAAIFQALGRYDEALALRWDAAERRPNFATLGALAGLQAECGAVSEAERLFDEARQCYQHVSPFPIAMLDFRRGLTWFEHGDLDAAHCWLNAARHRVPSYAPALGHLAEVDAALGQGAAAIARLRPLAISADDPEYAGLLAGLLSEGGQIEAAHEWRARAVERYDELTRRHPAAFADHAAEFWLGAGGDAPKAFRLAQQNLAARPTPRAYALLQRTALASMRDTMTR